MLNKFKSKGQPVTIKNCVIQQSRVTKKLEVLLKGKKDYDRITVTVKVVNAGTPEVVGKNKKKRHSTSVANLTVWEQDIDKFEILPAKPLRCTVIQGQMVPIVSTHSLSDILDETDNIENDDTLLKQDSVVGVHKLEELYTCFQCKKGSYKTPTTVRVNTAT